MSSAEQEKAQKEVVHELEMARDAKKRAHELEWANKIESGEIDPEDYDELVVIGNSSSEDAGGEHTEKGDQAIGSDEWESEVEVEVEAAITDLRSIEKEYRDAFLVKLNRLEKKAREKEAELF
jgi:hypothetical protein